MALIKCSECGKEISDKSTACVHCGCPIELNLENQQIDNVKEESAPSRKNESIFNTKLISVLCKVIFAFAIFAEISSFGGYSNIPILFVSSVFLMLELLFLFFTFPKDTKAIKVTSALLSATELLYGVGMIFFSTTTKGQVLLPIMCLTNVVIWFSIFLKISNKPIVLLEKIKPLYIIIPLLKPIIFLIVNFDFNGFLLWLPSALACAIVGYLIGFNKISNNYSYEDLVRIRKVNLAGFMLVVFAPIGLFLTWKNKCFNTIIRVLGSLMSVVWFVFIIILIIPCDHNWINGSCTKAPECDVCGEVAESPLGHTEGDWSEWDIDYDEAVNVRKKCCIVCEEVIESETEDVESFVNDNGFIIHPAGFANRFEEQSTRLKNIEYKVEQEYNENISFHNEENTVFYRLKDRKNNYSDIGIISFNKNDGTTVPISNNHSENCIGEINILIEDNYDVSAVVYSAILAIDPKISYNDAADVGQKVVNSIAIAVGEINDSDFKGIDYNGVNYLLYRDQEYHYLIIKPVEN